MNENDARKALLVRSWETAPRGSVQWSDEDATWASREAARAEGESASDDVFVARRAGVATGRIIERSPAAARTLAMLRWRGWVPWAIIGLAFLLGIAGDAIGSGDRINVLAPPLLGLLAWNLAVYLLSAMRKLQARAGEAAAGAAQRVLAPQGPLARIVARVAHVGIVSPPTSSATSRTASSAGNSASHPAGAETDVLHRFQRDWVSASAGLNTTRLVRILHMGSIALVLGALAGMYLRGLGVEYRAGWESTFLSAASVETMLRVVLGPASWLSGIALPDAARLEAMRFPETMGEPAAPWIHLYAITAVLFVALPRTFLALRAWFVERRLAASFPLDLHTTYFRSLRRSLGGQPQRVQVVPCNYEPSPTVIAGLSEMLARALGAPVRLELADPVAYGDEEEAGSRLTHEPAASTVLGLAAATATPEAEHQLVFAQSLRDALAPESALVMLVDESGFVTRFGSDETASRRRAERRSAWRKLLAGSGIVPVCTDLERDDRDEAAATLRAVLDHTHDTPRPAQV